MIRLIFILAIICLALYSTFLSSKSSDISDFSPVFLILLIALVLVVVAFIRKSEEAKKENIRPNVNSASHRNTNEEHLTEKSVNALSELEQYLDESGDPLNSEFFQLSKKIHSKDISVGEDIADECYVNGLLKGEFVKLSDIENMIQESTSHPAQTLNGFYKRMKEYVESGEVVSIPLEKNELVFVHKNHEGRLQNAIKSNLQ